MYIQNQNQYKSCLLQTHYYFKLDFQKVDQHIGGNMLIHDTIHHKDNQLESLELTYRLSYKII